MGAIGKDSDSKSGFGVPCTGNGDGEDGNETDVVFCHEIGEQGLNRGVGYRCLDSREDDISGVSDMGGELIDELWFDFG